jgi:hypothetical protein
MADMNGVAKLQGLHDGRNIRGVSIHFVARVGLVRSAMATPVMRDYAIAL